MCANTHEALNNEGLCVLCVFNVGSKSNIPEWLESFAADVVVGDLLQTECFKRRFLGPDKLLMGCSRNTGSSIVF